MSKNSKIDADDSVNSVSVENEKCKLSMNEQKGEEMCEKFVSVSVSASATVSVTAIASASASASASLSAIASSNNLKRNAQTQHGDYRSVDEENIVVLPKCLSPEPAVADGDETEIQVVWFELFEQHDQVSTMLFC